MVSGRRPCTLNMDGRGVWLLRLAMWERVHVHAHRGLEEGFHD